jgi:hypothetical protein
MFHVEGRMDGDIKLIVAFRNFVNVPKIFVVVPWTLL